MTRNRRVLRTGLRARDIKLQGFNRTSQKNDLHVNDFTGSTSAKVGSWCSGCVSALGWRLHTCSNGSAGAVAAAQEQWRQHRCIGGREGAVVRQRRCSVGSAGAVAATQVKWRQHMYSGENTGAVAATQVNWWRHR